MHCKCLGVSPRQCRCIRCNAEKMVVPAVAHVPSSASSVGPSKAYCCVHQEGKIKATLSKVIESFYDTCAAYNIRHCPFQDLSHKGHVKSALCDLCVITCFLIANTVVFLTIISRAVVHTTGAVVNMVKWAVGKVKVSPTPVPVCPFQAELFENQIGLLDLN